MSAGTKREPSYQHVEPRPRMVLQPPSQRQSHRDAGGPHAAGRGVTINIVLEAERTFGKHRAGGAITRVAVASNAHQHPLPIDRLAGEHELGAA